MTEDISEFFRVYIFHALWAKSTHPVFVLGRMIGGCMTRYAIENSTIRHISEMTGVIKLNFSRCIP